MFHIPFKNNPQIFVAFIKTEYLSLSGPDHFVYTHIWEAFWSNIFNLLLLTRLSDLLFCQCCHVVFMKELFWLQVLRFKCPNYSTAVSTSSETSV